MTCASSAQAIGPRTSLSPLSHEHGNRTLCRQAQAARGAHGWLRGRTLRRRKNTTEFSDKPRAFSRRVGSKLPGVWCSQSCGCLRAWLVPPEPPLPLHRKLHFPRPLNPGRQHRQRGIQIFGPCVLYTCEPPTYIFM